MIKPIMKSEFFYACLPKTRGPTTPRPGRIFWTRCMNTSTSAWGLPPT